MKTRRNSHILHGDGPFLGIPNSANAVLRADLVHVRHQNPPLSLAILTLSKFNSLQARLWDIISLAQLITQSNIKAFVLPMLSFAMLGVASGRVTTNANPTWEQLALATPHAALYLWLFVLYFDCSNQKSPESVEEDRLNKPWRAIPCGRLTIQAAETWYLTAICLLVATTGLWLGGFPEAMAFLVQVRIHDYTGASSSWLGKNMMNAIGIATSQLGAARVAAKFLGSASISRDGYTWCALICLNTFSTIHVQDFRDREGDAARGRQTLPIVMGDSPARWFTGVLIVLWSFAAPAYWAPGRWTAGHVFPVLFGGLLVFRLLTHRSAKDDRLTYAVLYCLLWVPSIYAIPLLARFSI